MKYLFFLKNNYLFYILVNLFINHKSSFVFGSFLKSISIEEIGFLLFTLTSILFIVLLFTSETPPYSIFYLILTFLSVSFLMLILQVEYLALTFIIVYVGAISMLFLFVIMMLDIRRSPVSLLLKQYNYFYMLFGFFLLILMIFEFYLLLWDSFNLITPSASLASQGLYNTENYILFDTKRHILPRLGLDHIGHFIYTHYFIYIFIIGFILLVPMIGAIVLTNHDNTKLYFFNKINSSAIVADLLSSNYTNNFFKDSEVSFLVYQHLAADTFVTYFYDPSIYSESKFFFYDLQLWMSQLDNLQIWSNWELCFFSETDGLPLYFSDISPIWVLNLEILQNVTISYLLIPGFLLFLFGLFGLAFIRKNILISLMSIEIMLLGLSLIYIIFSLYWVNAIGMSVVLLILCVAAAEVVIALAMTVGIYRNNQSVLVSVFNRLRN